MAMKPAIVIIIALVVISRTISQDLGDSGFHCNLIYGREVRMCIFYCYEFKNLKSPDENNIYNISKPKVTVVHILTLNTSFFPLEGNLFVNLLWPFVALENHISASLPLLYFLLYRLCA